MYWWELSSHVMVFANKSPMSHLLYMTFAPVGWFELMCLTAALLKTQQPQ